MQTFVLLLFFLVFCVFSGVFPYTIPDVKFEQLGEKFRVSIPNYAGIKNVAFNINRNHPFTSFEQGEFSGQVRNPINDRWEYEVFRKLNDDDVIYVWTHVQYNNIVYRSISEPFTMHLPVSKPATETVVKPITVNQTPKPNCEASITTYKNRAACKGDLIFEENFDTLSTNVWQEEVRFPMENVAGVEFVRYDTNSAIKDGILSLKASVDEQASDIDLGQRCTGHADECVFNTDNINRPLPKVRTARINTKNSMSFKYGRIDIRAQFPQGDWLIPHVDGIEKVVYIIQINGQCPVQLAYTDVSENNVWTTGYIDAARQNYNQIKVKVLVQYKNTFHETTAQWQIQNGHVQSVAIQANTDESDFCTATNMENNSPDTNYLLDVRMDGLLFEDDFNTATLDLNRWNYDIRLRLSGLLNEEFVAFYNSEQNSFIDQSDGDGVLNIVPTLAPHDIRYGEVNFGELCTATGERECNITTGGSFVFLPPVYSAQIHTKNSFSFQYGRVDVKAKLPKGDWLIPYIMLVPVSADLDSLNARQIRIAFARGNSVLRNEHNDDISGHTLYGGTVFGFTDTDYIKDFRSVTREKHFGEEFHVYSLIWNKDSITLALDGENYGTIMEHMKYFRETCYIVLGVSAGGHLAFPNKLRTAKPWENTSPKAILEFWQNRQQWLSTWNGSAAMKIDYVRVYSDV